MANIIGFGAVTNAGRTQIDPRIMRTVAKAMVDAQAKLDGPAIPDAELDAAEQERMKSVLAAFCKKRYPEEKRTLRFKVSPASKLSEVRMSASYDGAVNAATIRHGNKTVESSGGQF